MILEEPRQNEADMQDIVAEAFRHAGWKVDEEPQPARHGIDFLVRKGDIAYAVEIKRVSEGRSDRLVPLISQAILQAQAYARAYGGNVAPLGVVLARRIPESVVEQIRSFVQENAPGVAVGILDLEGLRSFHGHGLEGLNQSPHRFSQKIIHEREERRVGLFSGVNQWMLKVLLAPKLSESLLAAPRKEYRNASELAQAAGVSVASAFRFVKQLKNERFLDESEVSLALVRIEELMRRWQHWQAANPNWREFRMRWLIRSDAPDAFYEAVRKAASHPQLPRIKRVSVRAAKHISGRAINLCVGLFSAAELLGLSFVHGGPRHLYVEEANSEVFQLLGFVRAREGEPVDAFVRVPSSGAAIFRAAVNVNGVPASDVLQIWLDVASHPARGSAQANEIWRRVLAPSLGIR